MRKTLLYYDSNFFKCYVHCDIFVEILNCQRIHLRLRNNRSICGSFWRHDDDVVRWWTLKLTLRRLQRARTLSWSFSSDCSCSFIRFCSICLLVRYSPKSKAKWHLARSMLRPHISVLCLHLHLVSTSGLEGDSWKRLRLVQRSLICNIVLIVGWKWWKIVLRSLTQTRPILIY